MKDSSARNSVSSRLLDYFGLEPDEARPTLLLASHLGLAMAGVICLKTVSDSVFLSEFEAKNLPYFDLAITAVVGFVVSRYMLLSARMPLPLLVAFTQGFLSLSVVGLWLLVRFDPRAGALLLYIWVGIFAVLLPSQVWSLAGAVFHTRQAKRVFSLIGSGVILGAALGGSFAGAAGPVIGAVNILPAVVVFVAAGASLAHLAARFADGPAKPSPTANKPSLRGSFRLVKGNRYLLLIALTILASTLVSTLVNYEFKAVAQAHFGPDRDALASFLGYFRGYIAVGSFLLHALLTGRLLRTAGLSVCLAILPTFLIGGVAGLALSSTIVAAVIARACDQGFRHSIDRASVELLYVPVSAAVRAQVKSFLDLVVSRGADALASLMLLALLNILGAGLREISFAALAVLAFWLLALWRLRGEYLTTLRSTIERRDLSSEALLEQLAGSQPSEALANQLESSDPREVESAVGWIQLSAPGAAQAHLASLLTHKDPAVRRKALDAVWAKAAPGCQLEAIAFLKMETDTAARIKALEYLTRFQDKASAGRLAELLGSDDPELAAMAAALLASQPAPIGPRARLTLNQFIDRIDSAPPERRALAARLVGLPGADRDGSSLARFLDDPEANVVRAALAGAAALTPQRLAKRVLALLDDARLGPEVRRVLAAYGTPIGSLLSERLNDPQSSLRARRQVARILGMIGGPAAARTPLAYLRKPNHQARTEALRSLVRIRSGAGAAHFDQDIVNRILESTLRRYYETALTWDALSGHDSPSARFLRRAVRERMNQALDEAFRLLALIYSPKEVQDAHYRITSGRAALKSNAIEFLDTRLGGNPQRAAFMVAVESTSPKRLIEAVEAGKALFQLDSLPYATAMKRLLDIPDPWLQSCACHAVVDSGVPGLSGRLSRLARHHDPVLHETAECALRRLRAA